MTELMIERIKKASSLVGKILCSAYYNMEYGGEIAIDSDKITGYKIEHGELYILLENNEPVKEIYVDSDALQIDFYPFHKKIVLTAHSTKENSAKKKLIRIKENNEDFLNENNKITISPYTKYLLEILSEYEKKKEIKFDINRFIENSYKRLKNADKDFEEYLIEREAKEICKK